MSHHPGQPCPPSPVTSKTPDLPKEYLISCEIYVSSAASSALRKPPLSRRKTEHTRRDGSALASRSTSIDDTQRKVKEKSSWMSLSKNSPGADYHWRSGCCKLSDEDDRCLLNIYVDETMLYQTIYVHMLNQTDIRQADTSLFFRKDCLGIYSVAGQRWSSINSLEPLYIHFTESGACHTWLALLRSYSKPEIYGRWYYPEDGGLYRMWRQVELTVVQGRNFGTQKSSTNNSTNHGVPNDVDGRQDGDAGDLDVFCEINFNDTLCGRTTVKKGVGSSDWHEGFTFYDLPPFESLEVFVWRDKKLLKPIALGSVRIPLANFRRAESVEGWFPVVQIGAAATGHQIGELRVKLKVDEEIILPSHAYKGLLQTLHTRNILDWMSDFDRKLQLKTVSSHLMYIAIAQNALLDQIFDLADREVEALPASHNTLFRGNTTLTKTVELCMAFYGKAFLEASIGNVIWRLCSEKVAIEIDPVRSGKSAKDVERNVEQLTYWCQEFWNQIYSTRNECPNEMRKLFEHLRRLVEKRYGIQDLQDSHNKELPCQAVSAFSFLRFIVPAVLHPHLFGLYPGLPSLTVQRSLTLIAKVIQSLANLNSNIHKEEYMRGVGDFIKGTIPQMIDYIMIISTPIPDECGILPGPTAHRHDRLSVINSLRQRSVAMPALDREAIPLLPYILDIPKHLAVVSSAIIRSSRSLDQLQQSGDASNQHLLNLRTKCFDIEEKALHRVSKLAAIISSSTPWPPSSSSTSPGDEEPLSSKSSPFMIKDLTELPSPQPSSPQARLRRKLTRPGTAPSKSGFLTRSQSKEPRSDGSLPSSPTDPSPSRLMSRGSEPDFIHGRLASFSEEDRSKVALRHQSLHPKYPSSDSITYSPSRRPTEHDTSFPRFPVQGTSTDSPTDASDDASRKRRGILRGILTRR